MTLLDAAEAARAHAAAWPKTAVVRIIADHDPDGITAAAVAAQWLTRQRRKFHVTFTWRRDAEFFESLDRDPEDPLLLVDLGADQLDTLADAADRGLVVDHHPPGDAEPGAGWAHLNPWHEGLDGARDACAATTALALAVATDDANWDLAPTALTGAVADRQHDPEFRGWNETVVQQALEGGHLEPATELAVDDEPIEDLLRWPPARLQSVLDGTPSLTVESLGVPGKARPSELSDEERQRVASTLTVRGLAAGDRPEEVRALLRRTFTSSKLDGATLSRAAGRLEAAARLGEPGVGLAWLLGDTAAVAELENLEERFSKAVHQAYERIHETVRDEGAYRVARIEDPGLLGAVSSSAIGRVVPGDKPFVLEAEADGSVVFSARGTHALVAAGLDLGSLLSRAASGVKGQAGGHAVAAGGRVPAEAYDAFAQALADALSRTVKEAA